MTDNTSWHVYSRSHMKEIADRAAFEQAMLNLGFHKLSNHTWTHTVQVNGQTAIPGILTTPITVDEQTALAHWKWGTLDTLVPR